MEENYSKMKGENQNLYEANKKLWTQIKDSKIGRFFGTNRREGESSQGQSNRWQQQAEEAQKKAEYCEGMHSSTFGKLEKCLESKRRWKAKAMNRKEKHQEILEKKVSVQKMVQVLEHQLQQQGGRINMILSEWRAEDENWRRRYKQVVDSSTWWEVENQGRQLYIEHLTTQVKKIVHESRRMAKKTEALLKRFMPTAHLKQQLLDFLEKARGQYNQIMCFYEKNSNMLNKYE